MRHCDSYQTSYRSLAESNRSIEVENNGAACCEGTVIFRRKPSAAGFRRVESALTLKLQGALSISPNTVAQLDV